MTYEEEVEFWELFRKYYKRSARKGQAMFNALYCVAPELADMIRGTEADPFYADERIGAFRDMLGL